MTDPSPGGAAQLPPELAERAARRRAAQRGNATAEPGPATAPPAAPQPAAARPARTVRPATGKASRLAVAGGAIGLSFGLVGAMAAAASADAGAPAAVVQRVVVPQAPVAAQPAQIIVMLPSNADTPITTIEVPAVAGAISIPDVPATPAPAVMASAPVAESHGS